MEDESALAPKRVAVPGRVLWVVLAIWMVALGFRVAYITKINPDQPLTGDGGYYNALGNSLPKEGFRRAFEFSMVAEETAAHPPGYPVLLSLGSRIGLTTPDDHRILTALVGSLAVPLLALSAGRLAGRRHVPFAQVDKSDRGAHPGRIAFAGARMSQGMFWVPSAGRLGMGVSLLSLHTIGLEWRSGLIAAPAVEGLPLMRRWNIVNRAAKQLSPAAEAFRYFVLSHGEAHLAAMFATEPA